MLPSVLFLSAAWFFILQKQLNLIYLAKVQQDQIPLNYDEYRYHRPEPRNESQPRHECGKSPSFDSFFKQSDAVLVFDPNPVMWQAMERSSERKDQTDQNKAKSKKSDEGKKQNFHLPIDDCIFLYIQVF